MPEQAIESILAGSRKSGMEILAKRGERTKKDLRILPVAIFVALPRGRAAWWQSACQPAHNKAANCAHKRPANLPPGNEPAKTNLSEEGY